MRLISARSWTLIILSAALQMLAFPMAGPLPAMRSTACWICLTPFLIGLLSPARSGKPHNLVQSFVLGYLCGFLWYLVNCYWIYQTMYLYGGLSKPISVGILILFSLYLGLYHALFAVLVWSARSLFQNSTKSLAVAPFLWVAVELMRGRITGFPWDLLGYSQIDNAILTRLAPLAGVMSLSFVIAAVNAVAALPFVTPRSSKRTLLATGALTAALLSQWVGNKVSITRSPATATMVSMQENLEVGAQGREVKPLSELEELDQLFTHWSEIP